MDFKEFRDFGIASIEFIINYLRSIRQRDVLPSIEPHSIIHSLPKEMPEHAEHWTNIIMDLEKIILPGLTHWQSPNFHAFFPSGSSTGSIVGELLIAGFGIVGFSWVCFLFHTINIFVYIRQHTIHKQTQYEGHPLN